MKYQVIPPSTLTFLKRLKKNNDREWFARNKEWYQEELRNLEQFTDQLLQEMNRHDRLETESGKKALFRIYRDIRFSKDKSPYKQHFSGVFRRATRARRGSYYFHLEPGNSFAAGGFWDPEPSDLKRIRDEFSYDAAPFRKILHSRNFIKWFGKMEGEKVKTTPKGFSSDDPALDLIRFRQFELIHYFSDKEVTSSNFLKQLNEAFRQMRPFLDYMSDVLSSNADGESLL